jgi:hypothetical protein
VDDLYERAIHVLDAEAALGHVPSGYQWTAATAPADGREA